MGPDKLYLKCCKFYMLYIHFHVFKDDMRLDFTAKIHVYLMDLFFSYYNKILSFVIS